MTATCTGMLLEIISYYSVKVSIDQMTSEKSVHVPLQGQQYCTFVQEKLWLFRH